MAKESDRRCPACDNHQPSMFLEVVGMATILGGVCGLVYWIAAHLRWEW